MEKLDFSELGKKGGSSKSILKKIACRENMRRLNKKKWIIYVVTYNKKYIGETTKKREALKLIHSHYYGGECTSLDHVVSNGRTGELIDWLDDYLKRYKME